MTNLTTKLNKLVLDDSPSEKLINACAEIDIESCFDPIFEPPIDFLEECRKRWENLMKDVYKRQGFQLLRRARVFRQLGHHLLQSALCGFVDLQKVRVQLLAHQQLVV